MFFSVLCHGTASLKAFMIKKSTTHVTNTYKIIEEEHLFHTSGEISKSVRLSDLISLSFYKAQV